MGIVATTPTMFAALLRTIDSDLLFLFLSSARKALQNFTVFSPHLRRLCTDLNEVEFFFCLLLLVDVQVSSENAMPLMSDVMFSNNKAAAAHTNSYTHSTTSAINKENKTISFVFFIRAFGVLQIFLYMLSQSHTYARASCPPSRAIAPLRSIHVVAMFHDCDYYSQPPLQHV